MTLDLVTYNEKIIDSFIKNYRKTRKSFSVEGIHKMRLSVKRLKALLRLLDNFREKPETKKILKRVNMLYKNAGALRDLQIQLKIFEKFREEAGNDFDLYINQLAVKKAKALLKLKQSFNDIQVDEIKNIRKNIRKYLDGIDNDELSEGCRQLVNEKMKDIENMSVAVTDDSVLHLIRKQLKEVLYIQETIEEQDHIIIDDKEKMELIAELEVILGEWHDFKVLFDHFLNLKNKGESYRNVLAALEKHKLSKQEDITTRLKQLTG